MTQRAIVAPLRERHLGNKVRRDPVRALRRIAARRIYECRFRLLALFELGQQLAQEFVVEAGANLAGIAKLAVVVITKQKRAETFARTLRIGEAADDHLLPLRAF